MTRDELHRLVDSLPEESLDAAGRLMQRAQDPMLATLDAAPEDDELLTDDDREAIAEAWDDPRAIPLTELKDS